MRERVFFVAGFFRNFCFSFGLSVFLLSFFVFFCCSIVDLLYANEVFEQNSKESVKKIKNKTDSSIEENKLLNVLEENKYRVEVTLYTDYYCIACDEVHKKLEYLKKRVNKLSIKYEIVTLSQKSVDTAYIVLYFKDKGIFEIFDTLMYKMDYIDRNAERVCAAMGYNLYDILKLNPKKMEQFKQKIYLNNNVLKKFSNGIAPLAIIKLFNKKGVIRETFITGDFSLTNICKTIQTLININ